jgi:hypothetical protein
MAGIHSQNESTREAETITGPADRRAGIVVAAVVVTGLLAAIYAGSGGLEHLDGALGGYLLATLVTASSLAFRITVFWRRPASAVYGRALLAGLRRPAALVATLRHASRDLAVQRFIARRGRLRRLAHVLLSWGTLASFAITVPLVWGWVRFEAAGPRAYQPLFWTMPGAPFDADAWLGTLVFHALDIAAVAVTLGCLYFLITRWRQREGGALVAFHAGPLLLLLLVALTGLALPLAGQRGAPWLFDVVALAHEAAVVALLIGLGFGKLTHVFVRPLQIGARLVRATEFAACRRCDAALAPAAQLTAVEGVLARRGLDLAGRPWICPPCRRRELATVHAGLLEAGFQPTLGVSGAGTSRTRRLAEVA